VKEKDLETKLREVEEMIRDNADAELKLLSRAQELQEYRRNVTAKYERYAKKLMLMTDGEFVPTNLPAIPPRKVNQEAVAAAAAAADGIAEVRGTCTE